MRQRISIMGKWAGIVLLLFAQSPLAEAGINDFAFRSDIEASPQKLQRVELPVDVLTALTRSDLADIGVFDRDGKQLPHTVQKTALQIMEEEMSLKFHVFDSFQKRHSKVVTTREQNQQDGQLSSFETTETIDTVKLRQDYLIELPDDRSIRNIELDWIQEPVNQLLQVQLEVGTDLDNLHSIDNDKVLSNANPVARFIHDLPQGQKYLRISAADNITRFELKSVTGHYMVKQPEPKLWYKIKPSLVSIEKQSYLNFLSPSVVAASDLRLTPGEAHSTVNATLYASNGEFKQKRRIHSRFRQHNISSSEVKPSLPVPLPDRNYRQWWVSLESQSAPAPEIELAYPVYEIIFLGNDKIPFTMAWGNYEGQSNRGNLAEFVNRDLSKVENRGSKVNIGSIQTAGGESRLAAKTRLPWSKWLLWVLLILAALVTGRMAFSLYREMNR